MEQKSHSFHNVEVSWWLTREIFSWPYYLKCLEFPLHSQSLHIKIMLFSKTYRQIPPMYVKHDYRSLKIDILLAKMGYLCFCRLKCNIFSEPFLLKKKYCRLLQSLQLPFYISYNAISRKNCFSWISIPGRHNVSKKINIYIKISISRSLYQHRNPEKVSTPTFFQLYVRLFALFPGYSFLLHNIFRI